MKSHTLYMDLHLTVSVPFVRFVPGQRKQADQKHLKEVIDMFLWCLESQNNLRQEGPLLKAGPPLILDQVAP